MFDFDTSGLLLSLSVTASLLVIPLLLQWLLPNLLWRLELYVILRGMFLLAIFVGYGLITWQPVSSPRADLSWRGTGIVCGGMLGLVLLGAWLSNYLETQNNHNILLSRNCGYGAKQTSIPQ
jgi:hypothetical protein